MPIGLVTARDGAVHLEPHPAYSSGFLGGVVMTAIGPLVFFGGAIAIAAYSPPSGTTPCFSGPPCTGGTETLPPPGQAPYIGGAVSMMVGGVMTIAGAVVAALSHHTKTSQLAFSGRSVTLTF